MDTTTGPNPTDRRGKLGTKRHVITTDKKGIIPLSLLLSHYCKYTHDMKAAAATNIHYR